MAPTDRAKSANGKAKTKAKSQVRSSKPGRMMLEKGHLVAPLFQSVT